MPSENFLPPAARKPQQNAQYAIPLAFRKRTLFKMDFAEAVYISELRTTPAGHASYRNVAYAMYEAVAKKYPALAKYFRVVDVREPVDLLKQMILVWRGHSCPRNACTAVKVASKGWLTDDTSASASAGRGRPALHKLTPLNSKL